MRRGWFFVILCLRGALAMKFMRLILIVRLVFSFLASDAWASGPGMAMKVPKFLTVQEMGSIDGLENTTAFGTADLEKRKIFHTEFKNVLKEVQSSVLSNITTKLVQSTSRWASKQMNSYVYHAPQKPLDFKPTLWLDGTKTGVLYEATLETLPSHHQLVTRWLKLFLLYDVEKKEVSTAVLTIRGQVLE